MFALAQQSDNDLAVSEVRLGDLPETNTKNDWLVPNVVDSQALIRYKGRLEIMRSARSAARGVVESRLRSQIILI